jgi:DNA polymerase III delta subunit
VAKSKLVRFTVFYGGETYLLDRELYRGKNWPGRLITELDGASSSEEEVISALEVRPFDGSEVAVILDNAQQMKVGKEFPAFVENCDPKDTSVVLVAIFRKPTLTGVWSKLGDKGRVIEHRSYKPWETEEIFKRLNREAGSHGLTLTQPAFKVLMMVYGENLQGATNEIQKLSFVIGKGGDITREHVLSVCPRQVPVMPWDVSDAAASKSLKQALKNTALLFKYMGEGAAVPIVASLMRQTERLLIGRSMLDQGKSKEAIGAALGMKPYAVEKQLLPSLQKHTCSALQMQMEMLCELETKVKGASQSKRTLVELAVHQLAA